MPGATVLSDLYMYAAKMPVAISVNMFRLRWTSEAQPRSSSGHPAHSTTGVASTSSIQGWWTPRNISTSSTAVGGRLSKKRRRMAVYSGFVSSVARLNAIGSSAIPHLGHAPGPGCRTSGCIGQVYSDAAGAAAIGWGFAPDAGIVPDRLQTLRRTLGTEMVGLALIFRRTRRALRVHRHAADGIDGASWHRLGLRRRMKVFLWVRLKLRDAPLEQKWYVLP